LNVLAGLVVALLLPAEATPAAAHHINSGLLAANAIVIPSLSQGQMAVIARYNGAIIDLAERQLRADDGLMRLLNFVNIQFNVCLWRLVPGSVTDEISPFNECLHAYLATTRALLLHLQATAEDPNLVDTLVRKIDLEMLSNNASPVLCRYSGEPFNAAEIIYPHWRDVLFHLPTLLTFLSVILMGGSFVTAMAWLLRKPHSRAT
jgi:hypothetical protein